MGTAPTLPSTLVGDEMLHLLAHLDADFVSQVADIILQAPDDAGEATFAATPPGQPVQQLFPPNSPVGVGEDEVLVGSAAAKLESGANIVGASIGDASAATCAAAAAKKVPAPPDHLFDHVYASQPFYEEEIVTSPLLRDEDGEEDISTYFNEENAKEIINFEDKPKRRLIRSRRESESSLSTVSAETRNNYDDDSAYESPPPSTSLLPASPAATSRAHAFTFADSTLRDCQRSRQGPRRYRRRKNDEDPFLNVNELFSPSPTSSSSSSSPFLIDDTEEETEKELSTLDFDLLDSLLTKDILNDSGQVILNEDWRGGGDGDGGGELKTDLENAFDECDDSEADLIKCFDSDDWESTFKEFFPQLCA